MKFLLPVYLFVQVSLQAIQSVSQGQISNSKMDSIITSGVLIKSIRNFISTKQHCDTASAPEQQCVFEVL